MPILELPIHSTPHFDLPILPQPASPGRAYRHQYTTCLPVRACPIFGSIKRDSPCGDTRNRDVPAALHQTVHSYLRQSSPSLPNKYKPIRDLRYLESPFHSLPATPRRRLSVVLRSYCADPFLPTPPRRSVSHRAAPRPTGHCLPNLTVPRRSVPITDWYCLSSLDNPRPSDQNRTGHNHH